MLPCNKQDFGQWSHSIGLWFLQILSNAGFKAQLLYREKHKHGTFILEKIWKGYKSYSIEYTSEYDCKQFPAYSR